MNRREALRTLGAGATAGALVGGVVLAATPSPAAAADPAFLVLTKYRAELAAFNSAPEEINDEDLNAQRDRTWGPFFERVNNDPASMPAATSFAGAVLALRVILEEDSLYAFDEALLRSALSYFEGRA